MGVQSEGEFILHIFSELDKIGHLPTAMSSSPTRSASPSAAERNTASEMWWMPAQITAKLEGNQSGLMFFGEQWDSPMLLV